MLIITYSSELNLHLSNFVKEYLKYVWKLFNQQIKSSLKKVLDWDMLNKETIMKQGFDGKADQRILQ